MAEKGRFHYQQPPQADFGQVGLRAEFGRRHSIGGTGLKTAEAPARVYNRKWETGGGLFTEGTGAIETPLLSAMAGRLSRQPSPRLVMEAGAGSGDQSFFLAQRLHSTNVVAIDTSPAAIRRIHERAPKQAESFAPGSQLTVVLRDLHKAVNGLRPNSLDGFHANSVFHFLPEEERLGLLTNLATKLSPNGLVAVSYKAVDHQDALYADPRTLVEPDHGKGVLVTPPDGIQRLFVERDNTKPIISEFTDAGLSLVGSYSWAVNGYDRAGQDSHFIGFLAQKAA